MGTRQLKGLLRVLRDAGVTSYASGDLKVTFGDRNAQAAPVFDDAPGEAASGEDLDLPDGVWDPRARIAELNRRKGRAS